MQKTAKNLSESDQGVYRKWMVGCGLFYGLIFTVLVALIFNHPPITPSDVAQVEDAEYTGAIQPAAKKPDIDAARTHAGTHGDCCDPATRKRMAESRLKSTRQ